MVVSVALEPASPVDYADLGGALSDAVTAEVPAAERAETEVTVTLSETATGTFTLGDGADADALTDAVEQNACQRTITCDVARTVGRGHHHVVLPKEGFWISFNILGRRGRKNQRWEVDLRPSLPLCFRFNCRNVQCEAAQQ